MPENEETPYRMRRVMARLVHKMAKSPSTAIVVLYVRKDIAFLD